MDPQSFIRLSIGALGLRLPVKASHSGKPSSGELISSCSCEIRLRGFPVQTTSVAVVSPPETNPDTKTISSCFYLEESELKALMAQGCFYSQNSALEVAVFTGRKWLTCGSNLIKQQVGTFKLDVSPEWLQGKSVTLHNGWTRIGRNKDETDKPGAELHLKVKLDPDPRYVFQFGDIVSSSPQILQLQGSIKQPIFSCKFSRDRVTQVDSLTNSWLPAVEGVDHEEERRERKGWKVKIHDLSGAAVAATFITTPFVPSTGCDWVAKSNPGAWLIVRPDVCRPGSWQPWGKLEAWRECGLKDSVFCKFHLFSGSLEGGQVLMSEIGLNCEKGGEFFIDSNRQTWTPSLSNQRNGGDCSGVGSTGGEFVMSCRVYGERKDSKPLVQLAVKHVTCIEDAAIFMALAAAVDLSILACRPFRRRRVRGSRLFF